MDRNVLLAGILDEFGDLLDAWRAAGGDVDASGTAVRLPALCSTLGSAVRIELPGGAAVVGQAVDVDAEGAIVIEAGGILRGTRRATWCISDRRNPLDNVADVPASEDPDRDAALRSRLDHIAGQVHDAALAAGRRADEVRVLLATKTIDAARIRVAMTAGYHLIGENRAQEVVAKADELADIDHECHFIGHLQSNKINVVLPHVSCVQTVDSAELADRLDRRLAQQGGVLDVLLQANVSGEPTKSGVALIELPALLEQVGRCERLRIRGYMTIGLNSADRRRCVPGTARWPTSGMTLRAGDCLVPRTRRSCPWG